MPRHTHCHARWQGWGEHAWPDTCKQEQAVGFSKQTSEPPYLPTPLSLYGLS